jgi:hypothetical protein
MLCYVWVLVGEFYRDMTIIKFGIGQKDDNGKRMRAILLTAPEQVYASSEQ